MTTGNTKKAELRQHLLPWLKQEMEVRPVKDFRLIFLDDDGKKRINYRSFGDLKIHVKNVLKPQFKVALATGPLENREFSRPVQKTPAARRGLACFSGQVLRGTSSGAR